MNNTVLIISRDTKIIKEIKTLLSQESYTILDVSDMQHAFPLLQNGISLVMLDERVLSIREDDSKQKIQNTFHIPVLLICTNEKKAENDRILFPLSYYQLRMKIANSLKQQPGTQKEEMQKREYLIKNISVNEMTKTCLKNGQYIPLTGIEFQILLLFLKNRKKVLSLQNIYESIWKEPFFYGAGNTVMVHIRNLRKKIEDDPDNPKIIRTLWGKGYYMDS